MRRQTKKFALTLLLSVALISANMQFVSAEEESLTDTSGESDDKSSDETDSSQDAGEAEKDGESDQPEDTDQSESTNQPEDTNQSGSSDQPENTNPSDTGAGTTDGGSTPDGETQNPVDKEDNVAGDNGEGSGEGQEEGTEQDGQNPDTITGEDGETADDTVSDDLTEGEQPEQTFVNKNGEEVKPSDLVGVDYNTIADSYDGETNAVKQYVVSDEVPAGTIISSYVDENGNLIIVISQGVAGTVQDEETAGAEEEKTILEEIADTFRLDSTNGGSGSAPTVDGSFTGWDDIPPSYEFNWNKPDAWVDGTHYTDTNSTDVRHEMKLYSDGENVYLRIVYAREFKNGQVANGNDFQFWIDNEQMAAYQVQWPDGNQLSYNSGEPGVYMVEVRHRDSSWSYVLTDGAVAYYRINENNLNNELELKIPMSEFVKQNPNINLDNYSMIGFFTPNLMQDKIYTAGASTGAEPFAAAAFLLVPTSCILIKKKNEKEGFGIA